MGFPETGGEGLHTAHISAIRIYYPFHPLAEKEVKAEKRLRHNGEYHYLVQLPDGTKALVPEWMAKEDAKKEICERIPQIQIPALQHLHRVLDTCPVTRVHHKVAINNTVHDGDDNAETSSKTGRTISASVCSNGDKNYAAKRRKGKAASVGVDSNLVRGSIPGDEDAGGQR